jgi:lipopolysaccharide/colanic/teichoic acid biosynthesis glycosyltransferase
VFFKHECVGLNGQPFHVWKFRTMIPDADKVQMDLFNQNEGNDVQFKMRRDPRVTPIGSVLRRFSLDELPQLFNVIRGDMSLVGPRPALAWEVENFPGWAMTRFTVRPGLTGLWQVSGRSRLTMLQGLRLDAVYVVRRTFWFDLVILLRTVPAVLGRGAR